MNLEEAKSKVDLWGHHLEHVHKYLFSVFSSKIPKSFLPFTSNKIMIAINKVAEEYHNISDKKAVDLLRRSMGPLAFYCDDNEALDKLTNYLESQELREIVLFRIKKISN